MSKLLFVVTYNVWDWYERLEKEWELRAIGKRYNSESIYDGREVQVNRAYTKTNFLGHIDGDPVAGNLDRILDEIDFRKIIPIAGTRDDAVRIIKGITDSEEYIACRIQKV